MQVLASQMPRIGPYVVATGFTSAFLGDERTLREFVLGDHVWRQLYASGTNSVLYFFNDDYDPLTDRQLRLGVNKDPELIARYNEFCGRPIAEVPDPFDCHKSYADHFAAAWIDRLHRLDIHPVLISAHRAYLSGQYDSFVQVTLDQYEDVQKTLESNFDSYSMRNLYRVQCKRCQCIDATNVVRVNSEEMLYSCERCDIELSVDRAALRGKLSWKLDCAARWNRFGVDIETFSKSHISALGTFAISRFVSERFYGGKVPTATKYGDLRISPELSFRLLEILPPQVLKALLLDHLGRDVEITRDLLEHFCRRFRVRARMSYVDYVRRQLPHDALREEMLREDPTRIGRGIANKDLITFGNRFSLFIYGRDYRMRFPSAGLVKDADPEVLEMTSVILQRVLSWREDMFPPPTNLPDLLKSQLKTLQVPKETYRFLRRLLGQLEGPHVTTLLIILPLEFLRAIYSIVEVALDSAEKGRASLRSTGPRDLAHRGAGNSTENENPRPEDAMERQQSLQGAFGNRGKS